MLLLDQSNAYGQTNRVGMTRVVEDEPVLRWSWGQALLLYAALVVYVLTSGGLTEGYRIHGGAIQGGGMDPMLMAVWYQRHTQGVHIWTRHGPRLRGPQATVDDTVIPANDHIVLEQEANATLQHAARMNLINNADKFDLVHLVPVKEGAMDAGRGAVLVDGHLVKAKARRAYVNLLGGDINWFSLATADKTVFRPKCKAMLSRLRLHVPSMVLLRVLIRGVLINAWTHKKIVKALADVLA